jgi:quercetin dioxygenase-like cupin family protein
MRKFALVLFVALALGVASFASAQDPIKSNPKVYHLVFENDAVRVLHVTVAPGAKTVLHEHPDNAVVVLSDSKMKFTGEDGTSQEVERKAGEAMWSPAGKHMGENTGTTPIEAIIVELKGNKAPTATIPESRPDVTTAPAFDNPRAAGIKATLGPAFHEPAGTTHDFDQVVVSLTPSNISLNVEGKTKTNWKKGEAAFIGRGQKHESKNPSGKPVDVFIVAIK